MRSRIIVAVCAVSALSLTSLTLLTSLMLQTIGGGVSLSAHHSFAAEFDDTKPLKIIGTLTKVEWSNPHIWYYVDVKNPDGTTTTWALSGGAPGQLMRRGITKDLLKIGATVNVDGFMAKDGSRNGFGRSVTYADGKNVFTSNAQDQQSR